MTRRALAKAIMREADGLDCPPEDSCRQPYWALQRRAPLAPLWRMGQRFRLPIARKLEAMNVRLVIQEQLEW